MYSVANKIIGISIIIANDLSFNAEIIDLLV